MRTAMLALAAGILLLRFLPQLPPMWSLPAMLVVGLAMLPTRCRMLAFFFFGLAWACLSAQWALDDRLPKELDWRAFWRAGRVVGLPYTRDGVVRFALVDIASRHAGRPSRVLLAW